MGWKLGQPKGGKWRCVLGWKSEEGRCLDTRSGKCGCGLPIPERASERDSASSSEVRKRVSDAKGAGERCVAGGFNDVQPELGSSQPCSSSSTSSGFLPTTAVAAEALPRSEANREMLVSGRLPCSASARPRCTCAGALGAGCGAAGLLIGCCQDGRATTLSSAFWRGSRGLGPGCVPGRFFSHFAPSVCLVGVGGVVGLGSLCSPSASTRPSLLLRRRCQFSVLILRATTTPTSY